ncbi:MAG: DUF3108 domain-containing protein [Pseudomonadota bacterium]
MRLANLLLVFIALVFSGGASAAELTPHTAEYKVSAGIAGGRMNTSLIRVGEQFHAKHSVRPTGLARMLTSSTIVESSTFESNDGLLMPTQYQSNDGISKDKGTIELVFDWEEEKLSGTVDLEDAAPVTVDQSLTELLHDRISIQYQLMQDLADGTERTVYRMYDPDGTRVLHITRLGDKRIKVRGKRYDAVGIRHQREGSSRTTTLWCVPALDYLPVLIEQRRKDELKARISLLRYTATALPSEPPA